MTASEVKLEDIQEALLDGLKDAIKARFAMIATNALSVSQEEVSKQFHAAFKNLKDTHDQAMAIARNVFVDA